MLADRIAGSPSGGTLKELSVLTVILPVPWAMRVMPFLSCAGPTDCVLLRAFELFLRRGSAEGGFSCRSNVARARGSSVGEPYLERSYAF
jgi:hypothetical protein